MIEWKVNGLYKADAGKVYSEIAGIGEGFTAEQIVEKARDKKSELHKCFEWDDTIAATKYRLHQARMIVCQLVVRTETKDNEPVTVRVISAAEERNVYKTTQVIVKSEPEYASVLARAIRELKAYKEKYKNITELHEIFDIIDELEAS